MTISLRLSELDGRLIKAYADYKKMTTSELLRKAVMEMIEEEYNKELEADILVIEGIK